MTALMDDSSPNQAAAGPSPDYRPTWTGSRVRVGIRRRPREQELRRLHLVWPASTPVRANPAALAAVAISSPSAKQGAYPTVNEASSIRPRKKSMPFSCAATTTWAVFLIDPTLTEELARVTPSTISASPAAVR
jgi:hypothetical protein